MFFFLILAFVKRWAVPLGPVFFLSLSGKQQLDGAIGALFFFYNWGYTSGFDGHEKGQPWGICQRALGCMGS